MTNTSRKPAMRPAVVEIDDVSFRRALRAVGLALAVQADGFRGHDEFDANVHIIITVDGTVYDDGWIAAQLLLAVGWNGSMVVAYGASPDGDEFEEGYYLVAIDLGDDEGQYLVLPGQEVTEERVDESGCVDLEFLGYFL